MRTLFNFPDKLLHSTRNSHPPPWKPPIRPFLTPIKIPYLSGPKTWKPAAGSKGFGSASSGKRKMTKYKDSDGSPKQIRNGRKVEEGEGESDEKISNEVMERVLLRILVSVGVPVVIGLTMLQGLSVVKEHNVWAVPRWLPVLTIFLSFGASVLGIAYGSLSTSWDEDDKGSTLGFEEFQKNWAEMWKETSDDQ